MNKLQVISSLNQSATGSKDTVYTDLALYTKGLSDGLTGKAAMSADSAMKVAEKQFKYREQVMRGLSRQERQKQGREGHSQRLAV